MEVVISQDRDRHGAGIPGPEPRVFRLLSASSTSGGVVKGFGLMLQATGFAQKGNSLRGITDWGIFHPKVQPTVSGWEVFLAEIEIVFEVGKEILASLGGRRARRIDLEVVALDDQKGVLEQRAIISFAAHLSLKGIQILGGDRVRHVHSLARWQIMNFLLYVGLAVSVFEATGITSTDLGIAGRSERREDNIVDLDLLGFATKIVAIVLLLFLRASHPREEDIIFVVKARAANAIPEAEVFSLMDPSRPERNVRVLGDSPKVRRAVGKSEALPVDRQYSNPGYKAIYVVTAPDPRVGPLLGLFEGLCGPGDAESLFRDIAITAASQEFLPVYRSEIVILTSAT